MKESAGLANNLKSIRTRLGLSQQDLATAAGVTRQTIGGLEAGLYSPSAAVALRLARAVGCRVEDLFWLEDDLPTIEAALTAELPTGGPIRVAMAQIEGRWAAHPLVGDEAFRLELAPADGIAAWNAGTQQLTVRLLDTPENLARTVVIAGCTPALSLWARSAERWYPGLRVHWTHANSMAALQSLASGHVHAAGVHLSDPSSGESNIPFVRRVITDRAVALVNLGVWEEGLLVAPGNPRRLLRGADLGRGNARLINREQGAGSRLLLDTLLQQDNVDSSTVTGYDTTVETHQEVARAVRRGRADAGVSSAAVAAMYGLDFIPQRRVRYDLALREESLALEPVRQLLSTLHHRWVRSQLEVLGGYDTRFTGETIIVGPGVAPGPEKRAPV